MRGVNQKQEDRKAALRQSHARMAVLISVVVTSSDLYRMCSETRRLYGWTQARKRRPRILFDPPRETRTQGTPLLLPRRVLGSPGEWRDSTSSRATTGVRRAYQRRALRVLTLRVLRQARSAGVRIRWQFGERVACCLASSSCLLVPQLWPEYSRTPGKKPRPEHSSPCRALDSLNVMKRAADAARTRITPGSHGANALVTD
jgi:hypothetical protein